jgi:Tfp pilus assembly protein PilF
VIEPLLEAERAMSFGLIDQAERLYRQVAQHDPGSSIAVVGLARVALERGDERSAYLEARRALKIDPDNPAAQHLVMRLGEVFEGRGETLPEIEAPSVTPEPVADATPVPAPARPAPAAPAPPAPAMPAAPRPRKRRSALDRLLGRRR